MAESVYDRVNDYGSVKITLASPNGSLDQFDPVELP